MPIPTDFNTTTVYGKYVNLDGTPGVGWVSFSASVNTALRSGGTKTSILPVPIRVQLDVDGAFSIELPATNDPDIAPSGWTYHVDERIGLYSKTYDIAVPLGAPIDITGVAPSAPITAMATFVRTLNGVAPDAYGNVELEIEDSTAQVGGIKWIALGDSLTSQQAGGAPYNGWVDLALLKSQGRLNLVYNAGVSGNTTTQMLARLQTDVLSKTPSVVTIMGGTNDITTGVSLATITGNLTSMVNQCKAAGAIVVLSTVTPRFDTTKIAATTALNNWIRDFASKNDCIILDAYSVTVDRATGKYAAGYPVSDADNVHMVRAGHNAIADLFNTTVLPKLPVGWITRPYTNADPTNLIANGLLTTLTSGVPTGFTQPAASAGNVEAVVSDTDFYGQAWETAQTSPAAFRSFSMNATAGTWAVGDRLRFVMKYKILSSTVPLGTLGGLDVRANFFGAAVPTIYMTRYQNAAGTFGIISQEIVVPASTTLVQIACVANPGTTYNMTTRVGELGIYNLTALGIS